MVGNAVQYNKSSRKKLVALSYLLLVMNYPKIQWLNTTFYF